MMTNEGNNYLQVQCTSIDVHTVSSIGVVRCGIFSERTFTWPWEYCEYSADLERGQLPFSCRSVLIHFSCHSLLDGTDSFVHDTRDTTCKG